MSVQSVSMQQPPPAILPAARHNEKAGADAPTPAGNPMVAPKTAPVADAGPESREQLEQAVEAVKKFVMPISSTLDFSIDEETGIRVVKVIDSSTQEVIRQIPSEEILQIARALDRLQGLLIRQKA